MQNPYLTLSSRALHSLLSLRPSSTRGEPKMTTYARPCPPPINTLPVELLSYIFTLGTHDCLEQPSNAEDTDRSPSFTTESVKSPLVIASVSQYWRRIAHNTPGLWTSLCITSELIRSVDEEGGQGVASSSSSRPSHILDTTHITSYLSLSRRYPLDILVDARDQEWDFFEPEITNSDFDSYTPPFSADHIHAVFSLLLPHLSRWRSLSILTDTWKPMHVALQSINPSITSFGAPLLESLSLMRCNDFISFSPEFQPNALKGPAFLSNTSIQSSPSLPPCDSILPRMQHLSLRGVHVDWPSLGDALSSSQTGLYSLELCSHCADVRPSLSEFRHLLAANPRLRDLIISGSAPLVSGDVDDVVDVIHHDLDAVLLPNLHSLTIGYRSAVEGQTVLQLIEAPNARTIILEDATYPADPEDIDAGTLLTYVGTGGFHDAKESYLVAYDLPNGLHYQVKPRKDSTSSIASTSTVVGQDGPGVYDEDDDDNETLVDFDTGKIRVPFPLLENVTLRSVRACPAPLRAFFGALNNLQRLELVGMSMHAVHALLPSPLESPKHLLESSYQPPFSASTCPCPQLQSLCIRAFDNMQIQDFDFIVNKFISERSVSGASDLKDVDIHLGPTTPIATCQVDLTHGEISCMEGGGPWNAGSHKSGVKVNVFRQEESDMEMGEYDFDDEILVGEEPFESGGAFNDPFFDAHYSGMGWLSVR